MPDDVTSFADETIEKTQQKKIEKLTELPLDSEDSIFRLLNLQQR